MKGYLLVQKDYRVGEECFVESRASENEFSVAFEDDGETGYFYALRNPPETGPQEILDALHIYESDEVPPEERQAHLQIIWSRDWLKCALVINGYCHALFDFENQGGHNRNEFPPPNEIWTRGSRELTPEMLARIFG
jgi:hypothetical protein